MNHQVQSEPPKEPTIELFKAYLEVSKQIDWVMYGSIPAIVIFCNVLATFLLKVVELSLAHGMHVPPFYILGLACLIGVLTFVVALIMICRLKRDQIRLWQGLAALERQLKVELGVGYFQYQIAKFPDPKRPFRRIVYIIAISLVILIIMIGGFLAYCCFFDQALGMRIFLGIY